MEPCLGLKEVLEPSYSAVSYSENIRSLERSLEGIQPLKLSKEGKKIFEQSTAEGQEPLERCSEKNEHCRIEIEHPEPSAKEALTYNGLKTDQVGLDTSSKTYPELDNSSMNYPELILKVESNLDNSLQRSLYPSSSETNSLSILSTSSNYSFTKTSCSTLTVKSRSSHLFVENRLKTISSSVVSDQPMETNPMELKSGEYHENSKWWMLVKRIFWNSSTEIQRRNKSLRRKADSIRIEISPPDLPDEKAEGSAGGADLTVANSSIQKAERTEKDETGKLLAPAEVSHYPENNGKPKTELKDQTELGEKDGEKNGLNIESLRRVTSRSSLSSTIGGIKDKISLSMPGDLKKKPEETRLRFVVLFLFLGCVSIVLTSHILYHQHIGELRLFPTVRLEEAERKMLLFDRDDRLVLTADLGVDLPQDLHPYSCIPTLSDQDNVRCIEWKDHARLHIARLDVKGLSCHRLTWQALSEHISPQDCWPVGEGAGHWYGGGESLSSRWPLDQGHINMSPFVTGDEDQTEWGNVIKKYFINSRGLSLMVEDTTPLSVSLNDQGHSGLCLKAHFDDFPYFYHRLDLPFLNYTVCSDGNLGEIYDGQLSRSFWDGHKDTDLEELSRLLQLPLWEVPDTAEGTFTLEEISAYLKTILGRGTAGPGGGDISRGFLLLNYKWQDTMGDIKLSDKLRGVDDIVSKSGLTLVLTLNPFVSTDSPNFKDGVKKGIFVMERNQNNSKNIPALTWFKDTPAAALLDVTNNDTSAWLKEKLRSVRENMNNTFFFLDTGNTFHTPHFFKFKVKLYNPDLYKEHFVKACMEEVQVIGVSGASAKRPKAPAFVHLTTLRSTWDSLRTIIPNVLNLGVIGYPFISPGPVGGKVGSPLLQIDRTKTSSSSSSSPNQLPQSKGKSVRAEVKSLNGSSIAEVELFTRWWQLATFLPQLHFTTAPSTYRSKNIAPIAKKLKDIKENIVNPELIRFGREAMEISRPVIRPLWMLNPTDEIAQRIDDEFLIGDKILVAPVLHENARRRNVYLPRTYNGQGVWKRGTDGTFFEGGQWLNNSIAELDTILFFIRQPEHARPGN